eukprot:CAMPEP_0178942150 /NCGR_PEP_ID=MMETSP0789-20121207/1823_1 /TAXON_ID=3005 /ORGANISM="Rhizosolenia setigera, Strain CCMP 1694" /LENGTH=237 /DNA_ID=CAMNT_0020621505 /DNA_START=47 /DNA_END=760 /DNA_ORIENTATION=-
MGCACCDCGTCILVLFFIFWGNIPEDIAPTSSPTLDLTWTPSSDLTVAYCNTDQDNYYIEQILLNAGYTSDQIPDDCNNTSADPKIVCDGDGKVIEISLGYGEDESVSNHTIPQGTLSENIMCLTELKRLSTVKENWLEGSIPWGLTRLQKLEYIYLASQAFTGSIPQEFSELKNLEELWVDGNSGVTGTVPEGMESLTWLAINLTSITDFPSSYCGFVDYEGSDVPNDKCPETDQK